MRVSTRLAHTRPDHVCFIKRQAHGGRGRRPAGFCRRCGTIREAHLAWVINQDLRGLVEGHPLLDEVIPIDRAAARASRSGLMVVSRFLADLPGGTV